MGSETKTLKNHSNSSIPKASSILKASSVLAAHRTLRILLHWLRQPVPSRICNVFPSIICTSLCLKFTRELVGKIFPRACGYQVDVRLPCAMVRVPVAEFNAEHLPWIYQYVVFEGKATAVYQYVNLNLLEVLLLLLHVDCGRIFLLLYV